MSRAARLRTHFRRIVRRTCCLMPMGVFARNGTDGQAAPSGDDARRKTQAWPISGLWRGVLLAGVYFAAAKLSLVFAIAPGYATPVWPPSGIAVAALLLRGSGCWPGIWIGAALANLTIQSSWSAALMIASGDTLEALVC